MTDYEAEGEKKKKRGFPLMQPQHVGRNFFIEFMILGPAFSIFFLYVLTISR